MRNEWWIGLTFVLFFSGCTLLTKAPPATPAVPAITSAPAFCSVAKPMTMADIDTTATRAEITAYNSDGGKYCGWSHGR